MGKNKKAAYSKREEEKANRIVKGLFIGLIVLAPCYYGRLCHVWIKTEEEEIVKSC